MAAEFGLVGRDRLEGSDLVLWDAIAGARGHMPVSYQSLMHSPGAARAVSQMGSYLRFESDVPEDVREAAVLVVNGRLDCPFGWVQHVPLALAAGVDQRAIDGLAAGELSPWLSPGQRIGALMAEESVAAGQVTVVTLASAREAFGVAQTIDLLLAIGYYSMMALYFRSLRLTLDLSGYFEFCAFCPEVGYHLIEDLERVQGDRRACVRGQVDEGLAELEDGPAQVDRAAELDLQLVGAVQDGQ
jgi:4-carboxymuconolactone decarboxylase